MRRSFRRVSCMRLSMTVAAYAVSWISRCSGVNCTSMRGNLGTGSRLPTRSARVCALVSDVAYCSARGRTSRCSSDASRLQASTLLRSSTIAWKRENKSSLAIVANFHVNSFNIKATNDCANNIRSSGDCFFSASDLLFLLARLPFANHHRIDSRSSIHEFFFSVVVAAQKQNIFLQPRVVVFIDERFFCPFGQF